MPTTTTEAAEIGRVENAVRTHGRPGNLKITDLRLAVVNGHPDYLLLRIDTNQGVHGLGEVRDAGHVENALQYKSILLGQNPCDVDLIFKVMKRFAGWGRESGGASGIEIALWDLVGKVYGVPCYQFLGGRYRDRIRIYGDTPTPEDARPEGFVAAVRSRVEAGLTFVKFDLNRKVFEAAEDRLLGRPTVGENPLYQRWRAPGSGPGARLSERGIEAAAAIVAAIRNAVGPGISLCTDHFGEGFMTADEVIRLGRGLERFGLAWMEDPLPRFDIAGH